MEKYSTEGLGGVGVTLVSVIRPSVFANWYLSKLGSYFPGRLGDRDPDFLNNPFQRDLLQVLERDFPVSQNVCILKVYREN